MPGSGIINLLLMLWAGGVVLTALVIFMMARGLLRPPRMTDGKAVYLLKRLSPGDLGLPFEEVRFQVRDQAGGGMIELAAWWIAPPNPSARTCIIIHGYADAKVGGIAWAPLWRDLGFNVLAIDLRGHGESGGTFTSAGYYERDDLCQVIDQLQTSREGQARQIVLFGVSLGAAVAAGVAAMREDIAAVVLESPYGHFVRAAAAHGRAMGMPLVRGQPLVARFAGWMIGADFDAVAPIRLIREITCPILLIHSSNDTLVDPADAAALRQVIEQHDAGGGASRFWEVPGAWHVLGLQTDPSAYRERVAEFLTDCRLCDAVTSGNTVDRE